MYTLGFETSCDDTCVGIIDENLNILANIKITRNYDKFGGVVPEIAARNHLKDINQALKQALEVSNIDLSLISCISATAGPGLINGLIVGYYFAQTLAQILNITFVPVHHIEAHMSVIHEPYPYLALIASGGHTMIVQCNNFYNYQIIANTLDDSAGELFDKVGRNLGFPFPAGPTIEEFAATSAVREIYSLPNKNKQNFSFSGLKTAFFNMPHLSKNDLSMLLQNTVAESFIEKIKIAQKTTGVNKIVFCGGVAANKFIRDKLKIFDISYPHLSLCTDNGVMVAMCGYKHLINKTKIINKKMDVFTQINIENWCTI